MLIQQLEECLGSADVATDAAHRRLYSTDFYREGETCAAVIRPRNAADLARAVKLVAAAGHGLIPRGGGMSYTGGYTPDSEQTIVVDMGAMNGIVACNPQDMTLTVQAGTTWEQIFQALKPQGLRLPFFGTFSGRLATVGGGLSNGAVFLGTARYGSAADNTLGLEVVCADGRIIKTGQAQFRNGKAFYRTHGPDLTGLFLHDAGILGIKTQATFKLIEMPSHTGYLSFAFPSAEVAATALSAIARSGAAEEAYVFDPETTARNLNTDSLKDNIRTLGKLVTSQSGVMAGLKAGAKVVAAGKQLVPKDAYSLHLVCAGRSESAVRDDLAHCANILSENQGEEIPNSIPMAVRAAPFSNLNGVLGPAGERWVALNAKVPHSDALNILAAFNKLMAGRRAQMDKLGITVSTLFIVMDTHAFSFEPVFHWPDTWLPPHRHVPEPGHLAKLVEPAANPEARKLVAELRGETIALFDQFGAASNQVGRTYPYRERLEPGARELIDGLKRQLDPDTRMNPGALGYTPKC